MFPKLFSARLELLQEMGASQEACAKWIAESVHAQQTDKGGAQYITHPARVVANLLTLPDFEALEPEWREASIVGAWLHDVVEDSGENGFPKVSLENLRDWGIGQAISVIELLTRPIDKSAAAQDAYYEAISSNRAARYVKWADIADNLNVKRLEKLPSDLRSKAEKKYAHALEILHMNEKQNAWLQKRIHIDPEKVTQSCPICKSWVDSSERYPDYICNKCTSRVVDENNAPIVFLNSNTNDIAPRNDGWIDGKHVYAAEAHFGGVVVRLAK
jgi:hypothetical protein